MAGALHTAAGSTRDLSGGMTRESGGRVRIARLALQVQDHEPQWCLGSKRQMFKTSELKNLSGLRCAVVVSEDW